MKKIGKKMSPIYRGAFYIRLEFNEHRRVLQPEAQIETDQPTQRGGPSRRRAI